MNTIVSCIKDWLSFCVDEHQFCRQRQLDGLFQDDEAIHLIDVVDHNITRASLRYGYVALSYVWGGVEQVMATTNIMGTLTRSGALQSEWKQIPRVVQDAITITAALGVRYLWVDSLCIVQDDVVRKHQQIAMMAEIFNRAKATFIACDGIDATSPLLPDKSSFDPLLVPSEPGSTFGTAARNLREALLSHTRDSPHARRGWTYQERFLSRRKVFFFER